MHHHMVDVEDKCDCKYAFYAKMSCGCSSLCKMSSAEITYVYHTYEVLCMRTAVVEKSYLHVCTLDAIS